MRSFWARRQRQQKRKRHAEKWMLSWFQATIKVDGNLFFLSFDLSAFFKNMHYRQTGHVFWFVYWCLFACFFGFHIIVLCLTRYDKAEMSLSKPLVSTVENFQVDKGSTLRIKSTSDKSVGYITDHWTFIYSSFVVSHTVTSWNLVWLVKYHH